MTARIFVLAMALVFAITPSMTFAWQATPEASTSVWSKNPDPIFTGEFIASDPTVLKDGELYRMFYTCWFPGEERFEGAICQATSSDGLTWEYLAGDGEVEGIAIRGREGAWDEHLEANYVIHRGGEYLLYYSGYKNEGYPAMGFPAGMAVARSTDGMNFERVNDGDPILEPTKGWYDNDAVYSPAIVEENGEFKMVYAGHCYTDCEQEYGVTLLGATSTDGLSWTKADEPVLQAVPELDWTKDGVAEPGLLQGPDGATYLFFTGLEGEGRVIGVARGESAFGPWDVFPEPIVTGTPGGFDHGGALAPDVHIEGNRTRMWFLGFNAEGVISIGYAEAPWPFWTE